MTCIMVSAKLRLSVTLCLSLALYVLPVCCSAADAGNTNGPVAPAGYVLLPTEQWQTLSSNSRLLQAKLMLLEDELMMLDKPSSELMEQLAIAKQQLSVSKTALSDANSSLKNAESLLQKTQQSYQALERQLEAERTEQTIQNKKAYRKGWLNGFCIGFGSGVAVALFK